MNKEIATLAGGCFWCTEAVFRRLKGVNSVIPGYSGGHVENPSYEEVSMQKTGHAEAINIEFDPSAISFEKLLEVFWVIHDPTTLNRQGNDIGPEYRSAIFYHSEKQKEIAEKSIKELEASGKYPNPVVTEVSAFKNFYEADARHKEFYEKNRENGYCRLVIDPKITKLYKEFGKDVKEDN